MHCFVESCLELTLLFQNSPNIIPQIRVPLKGWDCIESCCSSIFQCLVGGLGVDFFFLFNSNNHLKYEYWSPDHIQSIPGDSLWCSWCAANRTVFSSHRTADGGGLVEKHYVFLKRLCQVLRALGNQLCALLVSTFWRVSGPSKERI